MCKTRVDILLVEDNTNDAELIIRALKKHKLDKGLQVVGDGAEALDFIFARGIYSDRSSDKLPKVVFLDLKLPKISGLEVLKMLKSDSLTRTVPVVVLTSSQEEQDIVNSYKLGVNSYLVKPICFSDFMRQIGDAASYWINLNKFAARYDYT